MGSGRGPVGDPDNSYGKGASYSNEDDFMEVPEMEIPDLNNNQQRLQIVETESHSHFVKDHPSIGFQGYVVETTEPFAGFHHIVIAYCLMAFVLMYPFVLCGWQCRESRKRRQAAALQQSNKQQQQQQQQQQDGGLTSPPGSEILQTFTGSKVANSTRGSEVTGSVSMDNTNNHSSSNNNHSKNNDAAHAHTSVVLPPQPALSACSSVPKGQKEGDLPNHDPVTVTPTTTKSTLQEDPDTPLSKEAPTPPVGLAPPGLNHRLNQPPSSHHRPQQHSQVASSTGALSRNAASAATTGRLYSAAAGGGRRASAAAWPRHKHSRRPSGDPSWQWRRAIQTERRHRSRRIEQLSALHPGAAGKGPVGSGGGGGGPNQRQVSSSTNNGLFRGAGGNAMSDLANNVLDAEQATDGAVMRSAALQQQQQQQLSKQRAPRKGYVGAEAALYSRNAMAMRQRQSSKQSQQQQQQQQQMPQRRMMRRPSQSGSVRSGSASVRSYDSGRYGYSVYQASVMSSIVDDISPLDAADADDPGKVRAFPTSAGVPIGMAGKAPCAAVCCTALEPWLDVAEPNEEWNRLLGLAIPMTLGSIVEPLSRCILLGILSQWVGTYAMVAYLLVNLLYRMTGEILSVAVTDAESALVQMALTSSAAGNNANQGQEGNTNNNNNGSTFTKGGYLLAGQYVQLSCLLQLILIGTVLLLWHFWIEDVIFWWVDSSEMASLAKSYFEIILILFLAQALYRAVTVPCHMRGTAHTTFETAMDIFVTAATLITSVVVLSQTADVPSEYQQQLDKNAYYSYSPEARVEDSRTALITVAWIQVNIGIAACVLKLAFCIVKGWLDHFWAGLIRSFAVLVSCFGF